jgi:DNA-binding transcriptional regulator YiaG
MKQQLNNYLKTHNFSNRSFALTHGFSPQQVGQWRTGKNEPSLKNYLKLMKVIG